MAAKMDPIMCHEKGCENIIYPDKMQYSQDYYVLINMTEAEPGCNAREILEDGLVGIFCKDCGFIALVEASANGFEITSRRE